MGQEIELKLTIDKSDVDRLVHHPFLARYATGSAVKQHLINQYFDTPEQILRKHAMALRIRFDGEKYIQTLKQKGTSRKGLALRGEWEWPVGGPDIDPTRVSLDIWPPELRTRLDRLTPVFQTDFERTVWPLRIRAGKNFDIKMPATVEMALDRGEVVAAATHSSVRDEILEIELELLEGETETLFRISRLLGEGIRLTPCDISKAERGYRLLDICCR